MGRAVAAMVTGVLTGTGACTSGVLIDGECGDIGSGGRGMGSAQVLLVALVHASARTIAIEVATAVDTSGRRNIPGRIGGSERERLYWIRLFESSSVSAIRLSLQDCVPASLRSAWSCCRSG